ncbi:MULTISPECIES: polysaccharide deacetylase family protein [Gordonia]|uniref:polysaccharide deacetylase family protein n=1 Tax=Gordonia TaxID=2053 RepID=UPI0002E057CD|nr:MULTISPECIES: polysaccharide deacetylase family protein [Gordonia]
MSVDLDNVWSYLKTHGDPEWEARPSYLPVAVPRIVELFGELDQRTTVFVIGADAVRDDGADAVSVFSGLGHEIGNHSFEHEPWLQRYDAAQLASEVDRTHEAIVAAGAPAPVGFRAPGYSHTPELFRLLIERGYRYDASVLPTWIGPLARYQHFRGAELTDEQREDRADLFGGFGQVRRSLHPHRMSTSSGDLVELPVTTLPLARVPVHGSYLVQLYSISPRLARGYFLAAVRMCRLRGVGMSMLIHPTDLLDGRDVAEMAFFPGMGIRAEEKNAFMAWVIRTMQANFDVVGTGDHVDAMSAPGVSMPAVEVG